MTRGYLLDTNIVSETRKRRPDASVVKWLAGLGPAEVYVSVLTVGELRRGAGRLAIRDAERAELLTRWVTKLETEFGGRILDVDASVMRAWAELPVTRTIPVIDSLLAATAAARNLTLATRNERDVEGLGVDVLDPWSPAG